MVNLITPETKLQMSKCHFNEQTRTVTRFKRPDIPPIHVHIFALPNTFGFVNVYFVEISHVAKELNKELRSLVITANTIVTNT